MTSVGIVGSDAPPTSQPRSDRNRLQQFLITCGVLASLLYVATDLIGGLLHPGYSFTSQMVSELMAVGAPSERIVDPLFLSYGVLMGAFGIAVAREGKGRSRGLQIAGLLIIAYAISGFTGPTLFEMHPRGSSALASDVPHIILTAVLVLLQLLTIAFAAFALGRRFRAYSMATMLLVIGLGVATAPMGDRLAAGLPTPYLGIIERILIYAALLWFAVLAIALVQRRHSNWEMP